MSNKAERGHRWYGLLSSWYTPRIFTAALSPPPRPICGGASFVWFAPSSQAFDGANTEPRSFAHEYIRAAQTPYPADNKFTAARELLGRTLFFDPRLSASDWISCATCHNPALSWGDGLAKGIGHHMKTLGRRTPTILKLAWAEPLFWDGRALTLEDQALGPIESPGEMNLPLDKMVAKLI